jgi:hypothetical protein
VPVASSGFLPSSASSLPSREDLQSEAGNARYHIGKLRFQPRLSLGGIGYSNELGSEESTGGGDATAAITGGAVFHLPLGRYAFVRSEQLPQYTWFLKNTSRRTFGGVSRTLLYTFIDRTTLEWTGHTSRTTGELSSELERSVSLRTLSGSVRGEYELTHRSSLLASAAAQRRRYDTEGFSGSDALLLRDLDGDDLALSAGIRHRFSARVAAGLSYERGRFTFENAGARRDHTSDGVLVSASFDRKKVALALFGGVRSFRAARGSGFPAHDGVSGGFTSSYKLARSVGIQVYGRSELVSSIWEGAPYFLEERVGGGVFLSTRLFAVTAAVERGANKYEPVGDAPRRRDDVTVLRGIVALPLYRGTGVTVNLSSSRYDSTVPGFDRTIFKVTGNVTLGVQREFIRR